MASFNFTNLARALAKAEIDFDTASFKVLLVSSVPTTTDTTGNKHTWIDRAGICQRAGQRRTGRRHPDGADRHGEQRRPRACFGRACWFDDDSADRNGARERAGVCGIHGDGVDGADCDGE